MKQIIQAVFWSMLSSLLPSISSGQVIVKNIIISAGNVVTENSYRLYDSYNGYTYSTGSSLTSFDFNSYSCSVPIIGDSLDYFDSIPNPPPYNNSQRILKIKFDTVLSTLTLKVSDSKTFTDPSGLESGSHSSGLICDSIKYNFNRQNNKITCNLTGTTLKGILSDIWNSDVSWVEPHGAGWLDSHQIINITDSAYINIEIALNQPLSVKLNNSDDWQNIRISQGFANSVIMIYGSGVLNSPVVCTDLIGRSYKLPPFIYDGETMKCSINGLPSGIYNLNIGKKILQFVAIH